ncbi:hypothetical protein [Alishewanella longhuensis]
MTAFFSSDFTGYALDDTAQVQDGREWSTRLLHDFPNIAGPLDVVVHNIAIQQISEQVMLAAVFFKLFLSEQSDVLQSLC